ncbi:hypothetical protein GCM10010919_10390 [Alishewanella longhuensis]|uniref:Uncharacterized protein n=1 Tax=Alishewanella longhuensis TaxID=1091037 RepID=A0ABQ3KXV2_9ALTE|nr:hypothetical protein [Alishewanella longhuensis]GHG64080.1 hypothetical protein GCM10010919_10390 [Alishewanella longhuensis]
MRFLVLALLLVSFCSQATFNYEGEVALHYVNGEQRTQKFSLALTREAGNYLFQVGSQSARVAAPPQKYALSLILQHDREVWVTDFTDQPLQAFVLTIADYKIILKQDQQATAARGKFILQFGDETYFFGRGPAQINFKLEPSGIVDIEIRGMFKPRR